MNCWVAVGLGHPTSMLQPFVDTVMTKLSESALLLLAQTHPPSFTFCPTGCKLQDFYPVTPADVEAPVRSLQCSSDPQLLKANADILSLFL